MLRYAGRRCVQAVVVLLGAAVLVHLAMFVLPGDPIRPKFGVRRPDPAVLAAEHERWGLDDPWPVQFGTFLRNLLTGDLGQSFFEGDVDRIVTTRYAVTLRLVVVAVLLQLTVGVAVGLLAAARPRGLVDRALSGSVTLLLGVPLVVLALAVGALPLYGLPPAVRQVLLPAAVLALLSTAVTARLTRMGLAEQMRESYVRLARAKGLGESRVVGGHMLRNVLAPVSAFVGAEVAALASSLPVVESAFALDGLGARVVRAARDNDVAPLVAIVAIFVLLAVVANLVADLAAAALDPQRRDVLT